MAGRSLRYALRIAAARGTRSVTARCSTGELALGGGWATRAGATVTGSGRSAPGAWTVEAGAASARASRILGARGSNVTAYAVCAKAVGR